MSEPTTSRNNVHLIYGIGFTIIALVALVALVVYKSRADTTQQNVGVSNTAPTIGTIYTTTAACEPAAGTACNASGNDTATFTVAEDTTTTIYFNTVVTDNNACTELALATATWTGVVARTNALTNNACAEDNNSCYNLTEAATEWAVGTNDLNACSGTGDIDVGAEATQVLQYYVDPTDAGSPNAGSNWTFAMSVTDGASNASSVVTDTFEMASLTAMVLEAAGNTALSTIGYGSVALAGTSSQFTMSVVNSGNRSFHDTVLGSAHGSPTGGTMYCNGIGSSNLDVGVVRYVTFSGSNFASGTALTGSAVLVSSGVSVAQRTNDSAESSSFRYWSISLPATAISGTCSNTVNVQTSITGT